MFQYFLIYKPFGMLSQFTHEGDHATLADLDFDFPKDVYPVGRLDADSEGLLLLTNDNALKTKLLEPRFKHKRTYYVQVEGQATQQACNAMSAGVVISINGKKYQTLPAKVTLLEEPELPERNPPIRFRKNIPTSWISVILHEGKNRQVRKMTAAVNFPTLRLARWAIGDISLADCPVNISPGIVWELAPAEITRLLR
ncbi:pseudouridine synthase [Dyadobacter luteus]|uniref:Pseudouridine synthase n=1 Tax=Dyadobacter luteus TaxID=2259619 RepID=A0A3D8Y6D1_9BACT|nr:pseudouridine synthase [Dyadobacter luteus]REA58349.1 pseudouridine synthase [Dyadobacter luteus]